MVNKNVIPLFFLIIGAFFIWALAILGLTSWFNNILFVIIWFLILVYSVKSNKRAVVLNIFMIYSMAMGVVCCLFVESGAYLSEIRVYGSVTGAVIRVGFTALVFILSTVWLTTLLDRYFQPVKVMDLKVNSVANFVIQTVMLFFVIGLFYLYDTYGTPNSNGVDRFYYWGNIAPEWGRYLQFLMLQISFLLGVKYASDKKIKYLMLLVISILMQIVGGEKFTGPALSIMFFVIPLLYYIRGDLISLLFRLRVLLLFSIVLFVLMLSSYLSYVKIYGDASVGLRYLVERIALQAQVWWAVDKIALSVNYELSLEWLLHNAFGYDSGSGNDVFGMYYLMQQIAPSDVFNRFVNNGVRFTMGAPVNYNYFFGNVLGPIVAALFGVLAAFGAWLIRNAIVTKDLLFGFVVIKYYYFIIQICVMSDWYYFINAKFWVFTLFIVFYSLILQRINIRKCIVE